MDFNFVTRDQDKYIEILDMFPRPIYWQPLTLDSSSDNPGKMALAQLDAAYDIIKKKYGKKNMVIVDIETLQIHALNKFPNNLVKQFIEIGIPNIEKMLREFDTRATVTCTIGIKYYNNGKYETNLFSGKCEGKLVFGRKINNKKAFGFDEIFLPDNSPHTFGEMAFEEKKIISHRGRAVLRFIKACVEEKLLPPENCNYFYGF